MSRPKLCVRKRNALARVGVFLTRHFQKGENFHDLLNLLILEVCTRSTSSSQVVSARDHRLAAPTCAHCSCCGAVQSCVSRLTVPHFIRVPHLREQFERRVIVDIAGQCLVKGALIEPIRRAVLRAVGHGAGPLFPSATALVARCSGAATAMACVLRACKVCVCFE